MASGFNRMSGDARKYTASSSGRNENRAPMSNSSLCRNGPQCRKYQEGTCNYSHDFSLVSANGFNVPKKSLTVDSPSFTPNFTPKIANVQPAKVGISPKAATAAAFTPRASGSVTPATASHSKESSADFIPRSFQQTQPFNEFVPGQSFVPQHQLEQDNSAQTPFSPYDEQMFAQTGIPNLDGTQPQLNPYAVQAPGASNQPFFQDTSSYKHPLNYHLYASMGPRRENLMAYQRSTSDFFVPDNLREDLQRKSEATLQTFANSTLPQNVEYFHSLVALDTSNQKAPSTFGYPSWVYKAVSSRDGHTYALRRIGGFRLTNESAIRTIQNWKRVSNSSIVHVHDAFTGRWFNDSSLVVVTDYHPMSQTISDKFFSPARLGGGNRPVGVVPENDLWSYVVQLAGALKAVHDAGLAAQTVVGSKVIITSKNRLRLNGCGIGDILQYEARKPLIELQRGDLQDLGRLILTIATRNQAAHQNVPKALDIVTRTYTVRLHACLAWLLNPLPSAPADDDSTSAAAQASASPSDYTISTLLTNIADKVLSTFDSTLHLEDDLMTHLSRELENGRLARLLCKLNTILERPETSLPAGPLPPNTNPHTLNQPSAAWSETGERYYLKLFRDYVFHQVDRDGRPVLDLGHMIGCLNKLDAGVDEKMQLMSCDEQNVFIVSYREVKRGFESCWGELMRGSSAGRR